MKKNFKRTISILLSILMIVGVFAIVPITASAAEETITINSGNDKLSNHGIQNLQQGNHLDFDGSGLPWGTFVAPAGKVFTKIVTNGVENVAMNWTGSAERVDHGNMMGEWYIDWETDEDGFRPFTISFTLADAITTYTVTWKNGDTTLKTDTVDKDAIPAYDGATPTKDDDDDYTYEFAGWKVGETTYGLSDALPQVTADVTYTAVFNGEPKHQAGYYAVGTMTNWKIDDNYLLTKNDAAQGDEYMLTNVALTANTAFKVVGYTAGQDWSWYPTGTGNDYAITSGGTYNIYFRPNGDGGDKWHYNVIYAAPTYTVTWKNWDGTELEKDENVAEGSTPTYDGEAPERAADAQNTYTFAAWDDGTTTYVLGVDDLPPVTGDVTYTAVFTGEPIPYTVTWMDWDGTVLKVDENVPYGTVPEYTGEEPTKRADRVNMYTFNGWTPEVVAVTGDAEYTATFDSEEITVPHGPQDDGTFYWLGEKQKAYKLIELEGDYYLVAEYNKYAKDQLRFLNASMVEGTDFAVGYYWFDADGKMTTLRNGPQADGCFYVNNERVNAYQLAEYEGNWYYICEYNKFAVNQRRYLNAATVEGTDFPAGYYDFDADGKMVIKNGPADDGYFYVNGVKQNAYKLVQYEGDWYFIAEYNKYAVNQRRYLNATVVEGTDFAAGYYYFGEDGEMTDEPEPEPTSKTVDLATLTAAYEAQDGDILTGTLEGDKQITIADGATVTLKDANITCLSSSAKYAGITPLGDATILLEETNTVKGGNRNYPGIYVPAGKTLIIDGTGSLNASSHGCGCGIGGGFEKAAGNTVINGGTITATGGEFAAGIGSGQYGSCGNITITGGTITANGGDDAAGIGSGDDGSCGNILITGGTVTANGRYTAAGIGSGYEATCGNITIADTVTQVTATKGKYSPNSIGAGDDGTCGTITIADPSKVTQN